MYSIKACKSDGPTENAPYPLCHANFDNAGDCVLIHLDEDNLRSSTNSDTAIVRDNRIARWT